MWTIPCVSRTTSTGPPRFESWTLLETGTPLPNGPEEPAGGPLEAWEHDAARAPEARKARTRAGFCTAQEYGRACEALHSDLRMPFDFDFAVIGSGFGGSVSALRLAEKGYSVAVLEMGKRWGKDDFAKTNWDLRKFLWRPGLGFY